MRTGALRIPLVALLLLCVLTPTAPAQVAAAPDERAAAREFSFAAYRLRLQVKANRAEVIARARRYGDPACRIDISKVSASRRRAAERTAVNLVGVAVLDVSLGPQLPALRRFEDELARVSTADPALRSGRAAWRKLGRLFADASAPADLCDSVAAWRSSRYSPRLAPRVGNVLDDDLLDDDSVDSKLAAAVRRMRVLGVGNSAARRFDGEAIFRKEDVLPKAAERLVGRFLDVGLEPER